MRLHSLRFVAALLLLLVARPVGAQGASFRVVVNSSNGLSAMSRAELARLFLKKATSWPDGKAAAPVDLVESAPARRAFTRAVLERDVAAVRAHWQQQIFSGRGVPPPEKSTDAEVLAFVRNNPGAVGYVSPDADLGSSVKALRVE